MKVDQALRDNLPDINIIDLLIEATNWTDIDKLFGPLSWHQKKVKVLGTSRQCAAAEGESGAQSVR